MERYSAKVIADSVSIKGKRMTTLEVEMPRFILAELNTHRMLSSNTASSRAIPIDKINQAIEANPAMPIYWGRNKSGMQSVELLDNADATMCESIWLSACNIAIQASYELAELGLHKQWSNRITEPFQTTKAIVSGTEWDNFFMLRADAEAQPDFQAVAKIMRETMDNSTPTLLQAGEWHVPYINRHKGEYYDANGDLLTVAEALKISASCCAQISYRRLNDTKEKALAVFEKLNIVPNNPKMHASPTEHQAMPIISNKEGINALYNPRTWQDGITHVTKDGQLGSGNLYGWVQYRKVL